MIYSIYQSFGFVSVRPLVYIFQEKNPQLNTKAFFETRGFLLLSLCAALAQASSFWQILSHVRSMELRKTKFALFVRFQSLRLESRLEN